MVDEVKPQLNFFFLYLGIILVIILVTIFLFSTNTTSTFETTIKEATNSSEIKSITYNSPPKMEIDVSKKYTATISTTKGNIIAELFVKEAPSTVNNFVFLAKHKFYNGIKFHRVIKDFMIQGGDPKGDGSGGPGYTFPDEKITRDYKRGTLAMANRGPNTNGSQFFIMHKDVELPKNYVIFGQVVSGMDTTEAIAEVQTIDNGYGEKSKPQEDIIIEEITIKEE